jgi:hypothetical protein
MMALFAWANTMHHVCLDPFRLVLEILTTAFKPSSPDTYAFRTG